MTGHRAGWRLWALLAFDPATGAATTVVAVAGVDGAGGEWVSWVPPEDLPAQGWQQRLADATAPLGDVLGWWEAEADGITIDLVALEAPPATDLAGAVQAAVDELLGEPGELPVAGGS